MTEAEGEIYGSRKKIDVVPPKHRWRRREELSDVATTNLKKTATRIKQDRLSLFKEFVVFSLRLDPRM